MSKFDKYFLMGVEDVKEYVREKLDIFRENAELGAKEIGDGNLNYVYKVWEDATGKSVIVKQAGHEARISDEIKLSTDRARIEAEVLIKQRGLAPGFVPEVYKYDDIMCCCSMQDLSDHIIMRTALIEHKKFPMFAEHISTFLVNTLLLTTDICTEHKEKKLDVQRYINPELCEISEDLVYTEPYNNLAERNNVFEPIKDFIKTELYEDKKLHTEVTKCKFDFMNNSQSLIHGDLHTGSIFVTEESTKVIDPEFAFYGPMGYDIGNLVANLLFAWNNANATIEDQNERESYLKWVEDTVIDMMELFIKKYNTVYDENAADYMAKSEGFKDWYLGTILRDTAAVSGLEMIRRIVGLANVKDITSISDKSKRAQAEKICILTGKDFIMNRERFKTGKDFVDVLKRALDIVEKD